MGEKVPDKCAVFKLLTSDGELGRCITKRNELVFATAVINDHFHGIRTKRHIVCFNGQ